MLDFLFARLTAGPQRGAKLFAAITSLAREPHWYVGGAVPDTLDGRFAVLSTVTALVLVRLEAEKDSGNIASVALTERFVEAMDSEHRELGLGDPKLGRTVRKLVGLLARRTELWRETVSGHSEWPMAARESLYKSGVSTDTLAHSASALQGLWTRLQSASVVEIEHGKFE